MTKQEFLEELKNLLKDIPKTERDSAVQYYEEYFEEAGIGDYERIPEDMETPEVIAKNIRASLENEASVEEEYFRKTENNMQTVQSKSKMDNSKIILLIILAVFSFPLWGSVLLSLFGVLVGIVAAILGIVIAIVAVMVSFLVAGIAIAVVGAVKIVISPVAGVTAMGVGMLMFGLGLLLLLLVIWSFSVMLPALFREIKKLIQRICGRREKGVNEKML